MHQGEKPSEAPAEFEPLRAPVLADPGTEEVPAAAEAPAPPPGAPRQNPRGRVVLGVLALGLLGLVVVGHFEPEPVLPPEVARPMPATPVVVAPTPPVPAGAPSTSSAPPAAPREVLRRVEGVPAVVQLSSHDHGLDLRGAGLPLSKMRARWWTVATAPSTGKVFPPYAALYVADFDANGGLLELALVSRRPRELHGDTARVFMAQPAHRPDRGSFDLLLTRGTEVTRYPEVYVDTVTPIDSRRFLVDGLSARATYSVRVRPTAEGVTPPVLMVLMRAQSEQHMVRARVDEPLDQQLLQPGVVATVTATSGLAFVVPAVPGAPERRVTVEVFKPGATTSPEAPLDLEQLPKEIESAAHWYVIGHGHLTRQEYSAANDAFTKCLAVAPKHPGCAQGLGTAVQKMRH